MKIDITYRNLPKDTHGPLRERLEILVERHLVPAVEAFSPQERRLRVTIEKRRNDHRVTGRLQLPPRKVLVAQHTDAAIDRALHEMLLELARQAERHRAHVSHREAWKRKARRQRLRRLKQRLGRGDGEDALHREVEVSLASLLPRLESWLRHELAYLRAAGQLPDDYPALADVRDELFVRARQRWETLPRDEDGLYQAALAILHEILDEEIRHARESAQTVSLEAVPPEDPMDQAEDMVEEEIGEFYQPDEVLHVEDLIADSEIPGPEEQLRAEAIDTCHELLGALPSLWRRALTLVHREGLPVAVVAERILAVDEEELRRVLALGERFLADHLAERGHAGVDVPRLLAR